MSLVNKTAAETLTALTTAVDPLITNPREVWYFDENGVFTKTEDFRIQRPTGTVGTGDTGYLSGVVNCGMTYLPSSKLSYSSPVIPLVDLPSFKGLPGCVGWEDAYTGTGTRYAIRTTGAFSSSEFATRGASAVVKIRGSTRKPIIGTKSSLSGSDFSLVSNNQLCDEVIYERDLGDGYWLFTAAAPGISTHSNFGVYQYAWQTNRPAIEFCLITAMQDTSALPLWNIPSTTRAGVNGYVYFSYGDTADDTMMANEIEVEFDVTVLYPGRTYASLRGSRQALFSVTMGSYYNGLDVLLVHDPDWEANNVRQFQAQGSMRQYIPGANGWTYTARLLDDIKVTPGGIRLKGTISISRRALTLDLGDNGRVAVNINESDVPDIGNLPRGRFQIGTNMNNPSIYTKGQIIHHFTVRKL